MRFFVGSVLTMLLVLGAVAADAPLPPASAMTTALAVLQAGNSVTLAWDANSETDLAGYRVYWGAASRTYGIPITVPLTELDNPAAPTFIVDGLANGTWFFAVTAYNTANLESGYSNEVSATISNPPQPPTGLRIQGPIAFLITGTEAQLAWKSDTARTSRIEYSYEGGPFRSQPVSQVAVTDHYVRLTGLVPGKLYSYEVICEVAGEDPLEAQGTFRTW